MLKELKEKLIILESRYAEVTKKFEDHKEQRPVNDGYFEKYDSLFSKQYKLERQIEKAKKLIDELEFIFND